MPPLHQHFRRDQRKGYRKDHTASPSCAQSRGERLDCRKHHCASGNAQRHRISTGELSSLGGNSKIASWMRPYGSCPMTIFGSFRQCLRMRKNPKFPIWRSAWASPLRSLANIGAALSMQGLSASVAVALSGSTCRISERALPSASLGFSRV